MTTSKRLIASAMLVASVGFPGIAQAVPVFSYEFTNSGEAVSPTDVVTPRVLLRNDPGSPDHLLGSNVFSASMTAGTFSPLYQFSFGNFFSQFVGMDLAPGDSLSLDFGTLTPNPGPIPAGTYAISHSVLVFHDAAGLPLSAANDSFSVTVAVAVPAAQVPEPDALLLVAIALAGAALSRRRRNAPASPGSSPAS